MIVAIIIAGGSGQRMNSDIPKQFIHVYNKPIIIYTLEAFQQHPQVDKILVVCKSGWENQLKAYADQYKISKLEWIIPGGNTGQESIKNGLFYLKSICSDSDTVIIHDGVRPLVDSSVLSDVIIKAEKYGNAVSSMPYNDQIFIANSDGETTEKYIPRNTIRRVITPQAYKYSIIENVYREAFQKNIGINGPTYANTLMVDFGYKLYFSLGSDKNFKITNQEDIDLFKVFIRRDLKDE